MKTLLLGTQNRGKIEELRALLGADYLVQGLEDLGKSPPTVVEDGNSYREHALKKALAYSGWAGCPVLADDSGLEVDALGGAPGVHSAYYGGENLTWPQRWAYLLEALKPFPQEKWTARFRCVLCYVDGTSAPQFFEGVAEGRVVPSPRGDKGFGYDPILWSTDLGMTFAEAPAERKNAVSHRARALFSFRQWLDRLEPRS
ncbi:non-canonical purine NTP pyrophosphatase [bacterium]|nr:non-canonical purine NTP pyrophosphatase [bacterium]